MNWLNKYWAFTYRQFIFAKRNLYTFLELLFWPVVTLVAVGMLTNFLGVEKNTLSFVFTGAICAGVLQITQLDISYSLLYDIWSKSLKHTFLAPVNNYHHILGSWLVGIVRGSFIFILLLIFSRYAFGVILAGWGPSLVFLAGIFLSALVIGMLVCFFLLLFGLRAEATAWSLAQLFMLICGFYYPVNFLPSFLIRVASYIPLTYFLEYYRSFFGFPPLFTHSLLKGFGLLVIYFLVMSQLLRMAFVRSQRTGMILRISE